MFALLSSFVFAGAATIAGLSVVGTFQESRSRIVDALRGRPLPRVRPSLLGAV
jgi:hypothetical protein